MASCPYCQNGEDTRRYTEIGLVQHLKNFHRRVAYANLMAIAIRLGKKEQGSCHKRQHTVSEEELDAERP